ncbi:MAG: complex I subunit 1/NuoH family protein, partial [Thermoplasmata archaeon]
LLQLIADAIKLLGKESILPKKRDDFVFKTAPFVVFIGLVAGFVLIPYGSFYYIGSLTITNSDVSLILFFGAIALMPIGELLAGIGSHDKYALIGAMRGVAKDVSFEIPMMLSAIGLVMMNSAVKNATPLNFNTLVSSQIIPYGILQPLGLFVFIIAMIARSAYSPFDLSESDSEIISGYSTEYTGLRFGLFYMGMFGSIFLGSLAISLLYLGGPNGPFSADVGFIYLLIKGFIVVLISFLIWLTFPRIRIDRFINFGWKVLLPIAMVNLIWVGFYTLWVIK